MKKVFTVVSGVLCLWIEQSSISVVRNILRTFHFLFIYRSKRFSLNFQNLFLSTFFSSLIFIVDKIDNKYWKARIFYKIWWQSQVFYHFPHFPLGLWNLKLFPRSVNMYIYTSWFYSFQILPLPSRTVNAGFPFPQYANLWF